MGRKALPAKLKVVKGTARKHRMNESEPQPESKLPDCPVWVHPEGKKEWGRLVDEMTKTGVVTGFDYIGLSTLCNMWGEYVEGAQTGEPVRDGQKSLIKSLMTPQIPQSAPACQTDTPDSGCSCFS